ncbi:MAG: YybS family protein [Spirochaetes bacterium]|nr:YybS family protein [Spirochaetota bacterium]
MELLLHFILGIALSVIIAILVYRLQSQIGAVALIIITVALYIGLSYLISEMVGIQFIIAGAVFGYAAKQFSFQRYFIISVLLLWFSLLVVYYLQYYMKGVDVVADNQKLIQQMIEGSSLGAAEKSVMLQQLSDFVPTMRILMPFSYFFSAIVISLFVYALVYAFFIRFKFLQNSDSRFSFFRVNEWVVFLLIVSWAAVLFGSHTHVIWAIALNIGLILCVLYTIQGLSIISYYFEKKQWPKLYGILLLFVATLLGFQVLFFIITMLMGLGIIDFWMNFRKIV